MMQLPRRSMLHSTTLLRLRVEQQQQPPPVLDGVQILYGRTFFHHHLQEAPWHQTLAHPQVASYQHSPDGLYDVFDPCYGQSRQPQEPGNTQRPPPWLRLHLQLCCMVDHQNQPGQYGPVTAATHNSAPIEFDARNSLVVCGNRLGANLLRPLPNLDMSIARDGNNSAVANLNGIYGSAMAVQTTDHGEWWLDGKLLGQVRLVTISSQSGDGGKVLAASARDMGATEDSGSPLGSLRFPLLSEDEDKVRSRLAVLEFKPSRSISPIGTIAGLLDEKEDEGLPNMLPPDKASLGPGVRSRSVISRSSSGLTTARILLG
ncbi:hypothetical protein HG531_013293 [Fusarium graminearum]|nr:hypothetical protein HG531_013293 [Fusarium graminearum]